MSFISDFGDMLPHTVFISRKIGTDSYNAPTYAGSVSYRARVLFGTEAQKEGGSGRFTTSQGETIVPSGVIWLNTTYLLDMADKFEFLRDTEPSPGDYSELYPIHIDAYPDETGMYFSKVYFK